MTTDEEVQRNLLRLHGLNLMNNVLREYEKDIHVITLVSRSGDWAPSCEVTS